MIPVEQIWKLRYRVVSYLRKLGASEDDCEDIASETCLRTCEKIGLYDPGKGELIWWMIRIARNLYISHLRKRRREVSHEMGFDDNNTV